MKLKIFAMIENILAQCFTMGVNVKFIVQIMDLWLIEISVEI